MRSSGLLLVLSLLSLFASAQSFTPVREIKNLSPAAVDKLHTLEELNALPPGDWRFHAGDIPHGESPTLDDSAWQLVHAPTTRNENVRAPKDAVWYRREIVIPRTVHGYDISGSTINFQFRADANGPMPEIIYFNGRRVALGDDLEPIVLTSPAHPGDKILVAVKLLHTVDEKNFTGVNMQITPALDSKRPNPNDLRVECISAANLLPALPTPRKDLLPRVEGAVAAIDTNALAKADQTAFDNSLRKAQSILAPLHPVLAQANITEDGNAHIDAAWLWPRSETVDVVKRTFSTALQLMNEYPDYAFTQSAAQYNEWMADKYPDINNQIKQRIKEGRWEIVGGMWVEPDLNIPSGESLVRQLLVGQRYFQKEYGVTARIGWNPDSFGYNWQLPQIYKRSGLDYFVTQKMHWNDTNQLPFRLFWWESPDGSKVLTYFPTDYAWTNVNPTRLTADFAESAERNPGTTHTLDLFGVGDHGGGPTRAMLDDANHWMALEQGTGPRAQGTEAISTDVSSRPERSAVERPASSNASAAGTSLPAALPTTHYGTAQSYFNFVEQHINPDSPTWNYDKLAQGWTAPPVGPNNTMGLPTWRDELYFEYHRGVYTTQAQHKANIRHSEVATLDTEKLNSFAWLMGASYPADEITENWKKITFNQFHDLAAGSGIAVIYRDAQKDFTQVFDTDKLMSQTALNTLDARIDTRVKAGVPILIANPSAWPRSETVTLHVQMPDTTEGVCIRGTDKGACQPAWIVNHDSATNTFDLRFPVVDVPPLGYQVLEAVPGASAVPQKAFFTATEITLSSGSLSVVVDRKTGCITKLEDATGHRYNDSHACFNELQTFADNPKNYDAWNVDYGTLDHPVPITDVDSVIASSDSLRESVRIIRSFSHSRIAQDISLDAGADFVRVDTTVDWHETHVLLKAAFPLAASSQKATFEIPYGTIERPTTRNNSFEKAKFEVPALRWADLGDEHQGVSILNDSKYGYDALGNTLRLTLLRSPIWPDPDADRGTQHFSYGIYPHTGTWKQADTVRRGYEFNDPLTATQVFAHTGTLPPTHSFASVDEKNVILTAVKKAEDADALIFRMYEVNGTPTQVHLHIPPGATYAIETNLMETPEASGNHLPLADNTITVPIKPYEILTLSVAYPHTAPR